MKYALVADDGQARVVVVASDFMEIIQNYADFYSIETKQISVPCKFYVCRREPSANGENLVTLETWEKGVKL